MFSSANLAVSLMRLARVSGFLALAIHSKIARLADRGKAEKLCRAELYREKAASRTSGASIAVDAPSLTIRDLFVLEIAVLDIGMTPQNDS